MTKVKKVSSERKKYELEIDGKKYKFRLTFMCWLNLEKRYGINAACIVDNFILGVDRITNMMRILSCAVVDDEISSEELADKIDFTPQNLEVLAEMTLAISGLDKKDDDGVKKNEYEPPDPKENIIDYDFYYTISKSYLGYSYHEFWHEANPYEVIETWNRYVKFNGWDKQEDSEVDDRNYYTLDDL